MKKLLFMFLLIGSFFASAQDWQAAYSEAVAVATKEKKPIILVFAGSDWCAPCIKLERNIWQSREFIDYSKENYVLYRADFPRKKNNQLPVEMARQNAELAETYNPKGYFPWVVVLNSDQEVLGTTGYENIAPDAYISLLNAYIQ